MVRHIVSWSFADGISDEENRANAQRIKRELEALPGIIDGIAELKVTIDLLPSSTRDAVLNSLFENAESLKAYQVHPEHKRVSAFVGSVMKDRVCIDFEE